MYQKILVPIDGSATSSKGLTEAIDLARVTGGVLMLLHVLDEMPMLMSSNGFGTMTGEIVDAMQASARAILDAGEAVVRKSGIHVETVLFDSLNGRLSEHVAREVAAWHADLVVLGTHGRRGVGRMLLGSDAEQVVRTSSVPVLLVRGAAA